jgi:hypothetical protein
MDGNNLLEANLVNNLLLYITVVKDPATVIITEYDNNFRLIIDIHLYANFYTLFQ